MNYDVIGDIHGQAGKLEALLAQIGYARQGRSWRPPAGQCAVFVGDLIDRGPEQARVVEIVRHMVDAGHAHCVLGNHEFNAIAWAMPREDGSEYLRKHSARNVQQHAEYLRQVGEGSALHHAHLAWFRTLPPTLDLGPIRAVHAWWNDAYVGVVRAATGGVVLDDAFMHAACTRGTALWEAMEGLIKGKELALPNGYSFLDPQGVERRHARVRWWIEQPASYGNYLLVPSCARELPQGPVPHADLEPAVQGTPIFVGHYWMRGVPTLDSAKVACVDYSAGQDGALVCYRWQGEAELDAGKFVSVS